MAYTFTKCNICQKPFEGKRLMSLKKAKEDVQRQLDDHRAEKHPNAPRQEA